MSLRLPHAFFFSMVLATIMPLCRGQDILSNFAGETESTSIFSDTNTTNVTGRTVAIDSDRIQECRRKKCSDGSLFDQLTFLMAMDGSKQPQDFGVNANSGLQGSMNLGIPLDKDRGIGLQFGTGVTGTLNAVRVYEILGQTSHRTQNFTTVGIFQRTDDGLSWGFVHDFLYEDYYDHFFIGQWRIRGAYQLTNSDQFGVTATLNSFSDTGTFGPSTQVSLKPITQGSLFWRRFWGTGAQTTAWVGIADGHGEDNIVTGFAPPKDEPFLYGADILMPLTRSLAIYGETNMILPYDTGTVDAFLGIQWYPSKNAFAARKGRFSPLMSLASPVSFAVDLFRQP